MKLEHGRHLAYCTNIHRGESWPEVMHALDQYVLPVRRAVGGDAPYAIGLRLSATAARELSEPTTLATFQRWLDQHGGYVFTVNGFPYGRFHGTRVKEQVYAPDWTTRERVDYTKTLFSLLAALVPRGVDGSVSTVPVSFKAFNPSPDALATARAHLWECVEHIESLTTRTGTTLHLGLEPEPLCTLETTPETIDFLARMDEDRPGDPRRRQCLGINYDCCHLAVEYEDARRSLDRLRDAGVRLSKIHLSSALAACPATPAPRQMLRAFSDDTYLHQVVERRPDGSLRRFTDLPDALAQPHLDPAPEWRIHFHVPLHHQPAAGAALGTTRQHVLDTLDWLAANPGLCTHLEMETYTWDVLPPDLRARGVVQQVADEYAWTLDQLRLRKLA